VAAKANVGDQDSHLMQLSAQGHNQLDSLGLANSSAASSACSTSSSSPAVGCESVYSSGCRTSGVFWIQPDSSQNAFQVYCSMDDPNGDGGGWTLVFGIQSSTYRSWLSGCTYSANMLDPTTADGCASNMALTLGKAQFIKWTDTSTSYTPFLLAEFQDIGDYYREVFEPGTTGTDNNVFVRYPKGPYSSWGWVSTVGQWRSFSSSNRHLWAHSINGYKCWWDADAGDRPFYNDGGGSNEANKCEGYDPPYQYPSTARRGGSFDYLIWVKDEAGLSPIATPSPTPNTTPNPTPSPAPSPTSSPTPQPTVSQAPMAGGVGGVAATGDPHLQNVLGQRFDLMKPGMHVLIHIPRGRHNNVLLRVQADARQVGGRCADVYFQELNITGEWVKATGSGGLRFQARSVQHERPKWLKLGKVQVKVARGRTQNGGQYLNFYAKHLGHPGLTVGGLLGEDDHTEAAIPSEACMHHLTLLKALSNQSRSAPVFSVAEASYA